MKLNTLASAIATLGLLCATGAAHAQAQSDVIRIGFITDGSSVYADIDGPAGAEAIRMAVADFGGTLNGKKIEVLYADHQNKADVASSRAREWFDQQNVQLLIGGTNSATGLAMQAVAAEKKRAFIAIGPGSSRITNEACTPYSIHYAYDTVALAKGTGTAVVKQGGKNWYFLTADYAFGQSLQEDATKVVNAAGGKVIGSTKHPLAASDFSSFLLQAQASKADVLALANAGGDTIASIKAANEFGVTKSMKLAGLLVFINDTHAVGLEAMQGLYLTDGWYWDMNDETRAWSAKFEAKVKRKPSMLQAADYSAVTQWLNAAKATNSTAAEDTIKYLKEHKINDFYAKNGYVREDGRMIYDMYLMQVKTPAESKGPWDYYKVVATLPGEEVYTTRAESRCSLIKK